MGSFAEYVIVPRADRNLRLIPQGVSFVEAAALGCRYTTVFRAVVQQGLQLSRGQEEQHVPRSVVRQERERTIAVFGCGGLGLSCVMISKAFQIEGRIKSIIAVDVSSQVLEKAPELGADHVVNITLLGMDNEAVQTKILQLTDGMGAELTIDVAGFTSTCENAVASTRRRGRMVQVGLPIGGRPPLINMAAVAGKEIEIVGSHGFAADDLPDLLDIVKQGKLDVKSLVVNEVSLEEGAQAIMDMDRGSPLGLTMVTQFGGSSKL